jgi:hypothetical protein
VFVGERCESHAGGTWLAGYSNVTAHRVSVDSEHASVHEPLLPGGSQEVCNGRVLATQGSGRFRSSSAGFNLQGSMRSSIDGSEELETGQSFSTYTSTG